jgi:hypothetical protein
VLPGKLFLIYEKGRRILHLVPESGKAKPFSHHPFHGKEAEKHEKDPAEFLESQAFDGDIGDGLEAAQGQDFIGQFGKVAAAMEASSGAQRDLR